MGKISAILRWLRGARSATDISASYTEFEREIDRLAELPFDEAEQQMGVKGYRRADSFAGYQTPKYFKPRRRIKLS
jgi:hypothetical protein